MTGIINRLPQPQPLKPSLKSSTVKQADIKRSNFAELLHTETQKQQGVKLSAHAQKRLSERNIALGPTDMAKINQAVMQAEAKGARDSLLIYGDLALIASVKNKTVVTAVDGQSLKDHIFTNIDSAVIIK